MQATQQKLLLKLLIYSPSQISMNVNLFLLELDLITILKNIFSII